MVRLLLLALGCAEAPADPVERDPAAGPLVRTPLAAPALLRRASLDLRAVPPSLDELARVEADPTALDAVVEDYLADPRLEPRFADLFAERWLLRRDALMMQHAYYGLDDTQEYAFERALEDEPARIAARVVAEDLPWSQVVAADWTMADPILARVLPVTVEEAGDTGWRRARYTDGRPALGVLGASGMWIRYSTTPGNLNRSRATAAVRLLLCTDYLTRPVSFASLADLAESDDLEDAVQDAPTCATCHSTLDPVAATLFGFWPYDRAEAHELTVYHAEREGLAEWYLGVRPSWFGTPVTAETLGATIAADPRFRTCGVQTFAELLWQRPVTTADAPTLAALGETWDQTGGSPHALLADLLQTPAWRVGAVQGGTEADRAGEATRRVLSPSQLAHAVEDLTGFRWTWEGFDQLGNDDVGYRVLAGGVDGDQITAPQTVPTVATTAVIRGLAVGAADAVVAHDLEGAPESRRLLTVAELDDGPGDAAFDDQLDELYLRLYARLPGEAERAADAALFAEVRDLADAGTAWRALVETLLRDPAFWTD